MKVRIKFSKKGSLRFIGHLDLMRTFQKIFRRSNIPIAYSEGFNPHQKFSIAAPLAVGITSDAEYMDIVLEKEVDIKHLIKEINQSCPNGIEMIDAVILDDNALAAMAAVTAAEYIIEQKENLINANLIERYMRQENIVISKKTKKGKINQVDLKPGIFQLHMNNNKIYMSISTGSKFNIKPDFILKTLCEFDALTYIPFDYKIHRLELYGGDEELKSLLAQ